MARRVIASPAPHNRRHRTVDVMAASTAEKVTGSSPPAAHGGGPQGPALSPSPPRPIIKAAHRRLTPKTVARNDARLRRLFEHARDVGAERLGGLRGEPAGEVGKLAHLRGRGLG